MWSPIAGGLLSGKHRRDKTAPEGRASSPAGREPPIRDEDRLWDIVDVLVAIGEARGVSAAQVALAWLLGRPGVTSLVIGGRTEAQFKDNIAAADLKLTADERAAARRGQPAAAALSLLAPGIYGAAPLRRGRQGDRIGRAETSVTDAYPRRLRRQPGGRREHPRFALRRGRSRRLLAGHIRWPTAIREIGQRELHDHAGGDQQGVIGDAARIHQLHHLRHHGDDRAGDEHRQRAFAEDGQRMVGLAPGQRSRRPGWRRSGSSPTGYAAAAAATGTSCRNRSARQAGRATTSLPQSGLCTQTSDATT